MSIHLCMHIERMSPCVIKSAFHLLYGYSAYQRKYANSFGFKPNLIFIHSAKDVVFSSPINFNKGPSKNSCYDYITNLGFIQ